MPTLTVQEAYELAVQHHRAGRLREAEAIYRQILGLQPGHVEALVMLAQLAYQAGQPAGAADLLSRAVQLRPQSADLHGNLGMALASCGKLAEAARAIRQALSLQPESAELHNNLANVLQAGAQVDEALAHYRRAVAIRPDYLDAWKNLTALLIRIARMDEAVAACRRMNAIHPRDAEALNLSGALTDLLVKRGLALQEQGKLLEADETFRNAIELRPDLSDGHNNLANVLWEQGRAQDAARAYEAALAARPDDPKPRFNLGLLQLATGDFTDGWENHEARFAANPQLNISKFPQPVWDGSDPTGRRILVQCEQGFGDSFQFIRYVALLARHGAHAIVRCPPEIRRLLEGQNWIEQVISTGDPIPPFDVHIPLLSLPRLFGTTVQSIPSEVPYLKADPALVDAWRERLAQESGRLKVGLVWAGRLRQRADQNRSVPTPALAPLVDIPDVTWVSLQKDSAESLPNAFGLIDWTSELSDFADTAALIEALDLVISIDTGVAHLAGALGKPTWVLLLRVPDWRWMLSGSESPWYPTMRLFRQPSPGDWTTPVRQIADLLRSGPPTNLNSLKDW